MMRPLLSLTAGLVLAAAAAAQDVPPRYEILYNPDLYLQVTPKDTLQSVLGAIARDRYDYVAAHLMDPEWVDARLFTNQTYFDRVAGEQIVSTAAGASLRGAALEARVHEASSRLNFRTLTGQIRAKLADEPEHVKLMRRFLREGDVQAAGDTAVMRLKDVPDRALYFKKVKDRWYVENRMEEAAAAPGPAPKEKE
jgi:hypothetical protein